MSTKISDSGLMLLAVFNELQEKEPNLDKGIHNEVGLALEDVEPALIELEKEGFINGLIWVKSDIDQKEIPSLNNVSLTPSGYAKVIELLN
ncbi:hypothetical protein [Gottfriedia luciferensis]|uniref:hypothetical protein n=1 Tax=Gottfriedia luciferensis TaxID=178774 RepID=UPI000B43936B|nr:hypothetical protein [Gottfriedia luciferensis]